MSTILQQIAGFEDQGINPNPSVITIPDTPAANPVYLADLQVRLITYIYCRTSKTWCHAHGKQHIGLAKLAKAQRVNRVTVSKWLNGTIILSMIRMDMLMRWLGVSVGDLLSQYEVMPTAKLQLDTTDAQELLIHQLKVMDSALNAEVTRVITESRSQTARLGMGRALMALDEVFRVLDINRDEITEAEEYTHGPDGEPLEGYDEVWEDEEANDHDENEAEETDDIENPTGE